MDLPRIVASKLEARKSIEYLCLLKLYSFPLQEFEADSVFMCTKARFVITWLGKVSLVEIICPAHSPDLNPTQHLGMNLNITAYLPETSA